MPMLPAPPELVDAFRATGAFLAEPQDAERRAEFATCIAARREALQEHDPSPERREAWKAGLSGAEPCMACKVRVAADRTRYRHPHSAFECRIKRRHGPNAADFSVAAFPVGATVTCTNPPFTGVITRVDQACRRHAVLVDGAEREYHLGFKWAHVTVTRGAHLGASCYLLTCVSRPRVRAPAGETVPTLSPPTPRATSALETAPPGPAPPNTPLAKRARVSPLSAPRMPQLPPLPTLSPPPLSPPAPEPTPPLTIEQKKEIAELLAALPPHLQSRAAHLLKHATGASPPVSSDEAFVELDLLRVDGAALRAACTQAFLRRSWWGSAWQPAATRGLPWARPHCTAWRRRWRPCHGSRCLRCWQRCRSLRFSRQASTALSASTCERWTTIRAGACDAVPPTYAAAAPCGDGGDSRVAGDPEAASLVVTLTMHCARNACAP